jgi:RNA polymerase sigma-70 factor (ECF subfamily)
VLQRRAAALYAILDRLPQHLREAFVLRDLEGLPIPEAATLLGVSEANLRVRAHRARERIHAALVGEGWIDPEAGVP